MEESFRGQINYSFFLCLEIKIRSKDPKLTHYQNLKSALNWTKFYEAFEIYFLTHHAKRPTEILQQVIAKKQKQKSSWPAHAHAENCMRQGRGWGPFCYPKSKLKTLRNRKKIENIQGLFICFVFLFYSNESIKNNQIYFFLIRLTF